VPEIHVGLLLRDRGAKIREPSAYKKKMTDDCTRPEPKSHSRKSIVRFSIDYIVEEWPSVLLVVALATIAKLQFNWLAAIDSYAFLALGGVGTAVVEQSHDPVKAVVVLIDEQAHEEQYHERSPLDRCTLRNHVEALYKATPELLAIDLDLSPIRVSADPETQRQEINCQHELDELIKTHSQVTPTILLKPFATVEDRSSRYSEIARKRARAWETDLKQAGLFFGDGRLPTAYGLLLEHYTEKHPTEPIFFANVARKIAGVPEKDNHHALTSLTNPRSYSDGLKIVPIGAGPSFPEIPANTPVFLGAGYGTDDHFITPLGTAFGVEAHAAVFAGKGVNEHEILHLFLDVFLDVLMGIGVGIMIARHWDKYFHRRFSEDPTERQRARFVIIRLSAWILLIAFVLTACSVVLLAHLGLWLSPIPITIGMMIDSFVSGSVDRGIEAGKEQKSALIEKLLAVPPDDRTRQVLEDEAFKVRHPAKTYLHPLTRHFGAEIRGLFQRDKHAAAWLLIMWTGVWLGAVIWAALLIIPD
jgi:hypothetical protein